jgi:hypothetical protein
MRFEDPCAFAEVAERLVDGDFPAEALAWAEQAVRFAPDLGAGFAARARARRALGDDDGALADLDALLARDPGGAAAHDARGVLLAEAGRLEEARAAFAAALTRDPGFARAHFGLAALGPVSPAHLAAMEALAGVGLDVPQRLYLLYALAKAYDDAGDPVRALASAGAGARLRAGPTPEQASANLRRLAESGPDGEAAPDPCADPTRQPIFVFGLPRSGTTLVEQILASHPQVHALGETERFAAALARGPAAPAYLASWPATARRARRVVDKSLGNLLHVGALRRAFPTARLVHVRRDPLDVCLSIHFRLFAGEMPFPFDLPAIGRYAREAAALMARWRAALPANALHEVVYERLVADPQGETRALLAFCGLPWEARCLAFHETVRPVATASLAQVRRPMYADAVGRARAYAPFLGPLRAALEGREN